VVIRRFVVRTASVSANNPMKINVDAIAPATMIVPKMVAFGTRVRPGVVSVRTDIVVPPLKIVPVTRIVVKVCRCVVRLFLVGIASVLESNQSFNVREVKDGEIVVFSDHASRKEEKMKMENNDALYIIIGLFDIV